MLNTHPDQNMVERVVTMVSNTGADMGHRGTPIPFVAKYHTLDANQVIAARTTIQERLTEKWIIGTYLLTDEIFNPLQPVLSPWFLVPKAASSPDNPKFRESQDLTKSGINDGIDQETNRTTYGSLEEALALIIVMCIGCWMYFIDIAHAYRNIKLQINWWRLSSAKSNLLRYRTTNGQPKFTIPMVGIRNGI
jgi:hypothetical protein